MGDTDYRGFGWKQGALLTHTMNLDESNSNYTLTFEDTSEYPLFGVKADNFKLSDKQFNPIWKPLFDVSCCLLDENGMQTGWAIAQYTVKVNSAGEALGADNKLCEYSGLPQDAYKLEDAADGNYNIVGTYTDSASFDGQPVKVYDPVLCLPESEGTISVGEDTIYLNSTTKQTASTTLVSNSPWAMVSDAPEYCTIAPTSGDGNATLSFYYNRYGGDDTITLRNLNSYEETSITVQNRTVICMSDQEFDNQTESFNISCRAYGGSDAWSWSVDNSGITATAVYSDGKKAGLDVVIDDTSITTERSWTFTFTHSDDSEEVKTCTITILAQDTTPFWRLMSRYCEES